MAQRRHGHGCPASAGVCGRSENTSQEPKCGEEEEEEAVEQGAAEEISGKTHQL